MVLDVCPPLPSPPDVVRLAVERTAAWAARAKRRATAHGEGQALFGIVQGGVDAGLRAESARRTVEVGFDGYGIGGLSVGESRDEMLDALAAALRRAARRRAPLPHGRGRPGRAGRGRRPRRRHVRLRAAHPARPPRHRADRRPAGCRCATRPWPPTTARSTRPAPARPARAARGRYLRHLFQVGEPTAARLLTLHNLHWTARAWCARARAAIARRHASPRLRAEVGRWHGARPSRRGAD